MLPVRAALLN